MRRTVLLITLSLAVAGPGHEIAAQNDACDRACLEGFVDRFLDAFVKHDPKTLPMAPNVKFTAKDGG